MLLDANNLDDGAALTADLCIVGTGAAGVTLAHALGTTSLRVLLLESGGMDIESASQALYAGTYSGTVPSIDSGYLTGSRFRRYGGSTTLWGGYCRPLEPLDFAARDWVPDSGWPITRADMDRHYRSASAHLGIDDFDDPALSAADPALPSHFDGDPFEERLYQFRFANVGAEHLDELTASDHTTIVLHANAVDVVLAAGGAAVDHVAIATIGGKRLSAKARAVVLAAGGIENARLLLASRGVNPNGVGNDHDLVGRYFMEHVVVTTLGPLFVWQSAPLKRYQQRGPDGTVQPFAATVHRVAMFLSLQEAALRHRGLLNVVVELGSAFAPVLSKFSDFDRSVMAAAEDLDGMRAVSGFVTPQKTTPVFICEQAPRATSRVTLGTDVDALGLPRVNLDWRLGDQELHTVETFASMLASGLGARRLGRMRLAPTRDEILAHVGGGNHHMGTARMHPDPARGVVDQDCRVHGVDNLFVAGSAVFPTGGSANPTFTIVALAFRLAEHLQGRLA